jgi:hypothetical protein
MDPHVGFANTAGISVLSFNLGKPLNDQLKNEFSITTPVAGRVICYCIREKVATNRGLYHYKPDSVDQCAA